MTSSSYSHYNIDIYQTNSDVIIRILDTQLFRTYEAIYDKMNIQSLGINTINNFYIICNDCFKLLKISGTIGVPSDDEDCSGIISLKIKKNKLVAELYYKKVLLFNPILEINLVDDAKLTTDKLIIKKLINELEECKNELKWFMSMVEIPIFEYTINTYDDGVNIQHIFNSQLTLPICTPNIVINYSLDSADPYKTISNDITTITTADPYIHLGPNFKRINVKILTIDNYQIPILNMENFPATLEEIIINNNSSLTSLSNVQHLTNLRKITFNCCSQLQTIKDTIKNLRIAHIIISACPKFVEASLLQSNTLKVEHK